jgi:hypothetical protein
METIYYLSTIIFICIELHWLISPIEKTNDVKKFFELSKQSKGKKWSELTKEYKSEIKSKVWSIFVLFWMFIGLFTFQWVAFLSIILFNILVIAPISKLTRFSITYTIIHWINSIIGFIFGIFVIINHYHLKIDLYKWLLDLI